MPRFEDAAELDDETPGRPCYAITDIAEASACSIGARVKKAVAWPGRGSGPELSRGKSPGPIRGHPR
jgi:hypothetical protein